MSPTRVQKLQGMIFDTLMKDGDMGTIRAMDLASVIVEKAQAEMLIGLPSDLPRTSVRTDLIATLGLIAGCRQGDDADDVISTVITSLGDG